MNQVLNLSQLQKIDIALDHIHQRLHEIEQIIAADVTIQQAEMNLSTSKSAYAASRTALKLADEKANSQRLKIETNESSLYAGKIQNPKELQDLQKEIASLKKYLITLEDQLLEAMLASEESQDHLKQAEGGLVAAQAEFSQRQASLLGERMALEQQKNRLLAERTACLAQIESPSLAIYERLRSQKRGVALSLIEDGACKCCGAMLRPAELQEAHSPDKLVFCNSCGRIIYIG